MAPPREEQERRKQKIEEAKAKRLRAEKLQQEHELRETQLLVSINIMRELFKLKLDIDVTNRNDSFLSSYMNEAHLPEICSSSDMHLFLSKWKYDEETVTWSLIMDMLSTLDSLIDNPLNSSPSTVNNWKHCSHSRSRVPTLNRKRYSLREKCSGSSISGPLNESPSDILGKFLRAFRPWLEGFNRKWNEQVVFNNLLVRQCFRNELQTSLDNETYLTLQNIRKNMSAITLETYKYHNSNEYFSLHLWTIIDLPKMASSDKSLPVIDFPECGVVITVPEKLQYTAITIRCLRLKYDHYSDTSTTWDPKPLPDVMKLDLYDFCKYLWTEKKNFEREQDKLIAEFEKEWRQRMDAQRIVKVDETNISPERTERENEDEGSESEDHNNLSDREPMEIKPPVVTYSEEDDLEQEVCGMRKCPDLIIKQLEDDLLEEMRRTLAPDVMENDVNMRRHVILGGVFHLEFIKQPHQPVTLPDQSIMTIFNGPHSLQMEDYQEAFDTSDAQKQESDEEDTSDSGAATQNAQLEKLAFVQISVPDNVLWFEPPSIARWDSGKQCWTKDYIYDIKFNEEKQFITFRSGKMGAYGLTCSRFINIPYQSWELRPEGEDSVLLSITAATIIVEFIIKGSEVCLNQLQNATSAVLQDMVGIYMDPVKLIRILKQGGIDIFPSYDAFIFMPNLTSKHLVMEFHVYYCLALFSLSYHFSWSRWNLAAGYFNIVLQIKELIERRKNTTFQILSVDPYRALFVDCTEVSSVFNNTGIFGTKVSI
ncbi:axonemal 84 kDa protein-like [Diaphorina citri]|uniref:Axonemal 84 kDa protein-like n=1 Tax=Diaphorina citri TaxID=121845 RepID=A0A3Q0J5E3_DIACI|nr:axonemal 84 kDa protein-like [Diaphorina citri]